MRFPYQGYPVQGVGTTRLTLVYRPVAPIRIIGPGGDALAYGLLDTGADDTLLPASFAGPLGAVLQPGARARIAGIGGKTITADFATVDLMLWRRRTVYRWSATVGFYNGHKTILGQSGMFEYFLASFNHRLRHTTLRQAARFPSQTCLHHDPNPVRPAPPADPDVSIESGRANPARLVRQWLTGDVRRDVDHTVCETERQATDPAQHPPADDPTHHGDGPTDRLSRHRPCLPSPTRRPRARGRLHFCLAGPSCPAY